MYRHKRQIEVTRNLIFTALNPVTPKFKSKKGTVNLTRVSKIINKVKSFN